AIGFNPMILSDYDKIGIDTNKEFGFVLTDLVVTEIEGKNVQANIGILFPVKENVNAYDFFKEKIFAQKTEEFVPSEVGNIITIKSAAEEDVLVTVTHDNAFLIFNISINMNGTVKKFIDKTKKMGSTSNYTEIQSAIDLGEDIAAYVDFKELLKNNGNLLEKLNDQFNDQPSISQLGLGTTEPLKFYRGMGANLDLDNSDLISKFAGFIDKNSPYLAMMLNAKKDKDVMLNFEQRPAILIALLLNFDKYIEFMLNNFPQEVKDTYNNQLTDIKTQIGIDLDQELIKQMAGSFNFGIYDANSINMMNYNAVINFNVKDPVAFQATLGKLASVGLTPMDDQGLIEAVGDENKDLVKGVKGYSVSLGMAVGYVLIDGDNVSIVSGKPTMIQLLNGSADKSFTKKLDGKIADKLKNKDNYLYLDIDESYKITKTIFGMIAGMTGTENQIDAKIDGFVKNFVYFYAQGGLDGEKSIGEYVVKTRFQKPFFLALKDEIQKMK
ncbi:MAG: hypothetical protein JXR69_07760, partial [Candidatus Delongbacteria bacterium]|nr:hypothetical protein [Candidatus Delongbacteria bacterium]